MEVVLIIGLNLVVCFLALKIVGVQMSVQSISLVMPIRRKMLFLKPNQTGTELTKNFYRLYKYMYLQASSGSRAEDMLKSLYRVVSTKQLKQSLMQMSAMISQNNDVHKALDYLKKQFQHDEGVILIGILESVAVSGLSNEAFLRLDHMLFQKYLSQLRRDTKNIKKLYFYSVVCFVIAASGVLFLPLIDQMFKSANIIFN